MICNGCWNAPATHTMGVDYLCDNCYRKAAVPTHLYVMRTFTANHPELAELVATFGAILANEGRIYG